MVLVYWPVLSGTRDSVRRLLFDSKPAWFGCVLFGGGLLTFGWLAQDLFQGVPHLGDSVAALFSAELFLSGRLTAPMPAHPEFFRQFGVLSAEHGVDRLAGMYPPGWPLVLAPGVALGATWLVNPILGGALAVATAALGAELYDRPVGRLAGLLVVLSPLLGVFSASHLSHVPTALWLCLGWWATVRIDRTGHPAWGLLAGGALGLALVTRPATAALIGLVVAFLPLSRPHHSLERWRPYLTAIVVVIVFACGLLAYQGATTGDPFTPGHRLVLGPDRGPGFGEYAEGQIHDLQRGLQHTLERVHVVDTTLLGWPVLASAVFLLPFLLGRAGLRELWLIAPYIALLGFFATFWYFPANYPGRYLTSALPPLLIACAATWRTTSDQLAARRGWSAVPTLVVVVGLLFSVLVARPLHLSFFEPHHGDIETVLPAMIADAEVTDALVFVRAEGWSDHHWDRQGDYYGSAFRLNTPDLDGDIVYARDLAPDNGRLIAAYPDRFYYSYVFQRGPKQGRLYRLVLRKNGTWRRVPARRSDMR